MGLPFDVIGVGKHKIIGRWLHFSVV